MEQPAQSITRYTSNLVNVNGLCQVYESLIRTLVRPFANKDLKADHRRPPSGERFT